MSVKVKECSIVCPAKDTPKHILWLSRLDMIGGLPYAHTRLVFIYSSKFFDTEILKKSLSQVLVPFYPLAGRLKMNDQKTRYEVDCNGEGVLFKVVETNHFLADFKGYKPTPEFRNLVLPTCDYSGDISSFPLLLVQITRFKCGGVCVGFGTHHHLGDGMSYSLFINSWARVAKGLELEMQPVFDRSPHLSPRNPPQVKFQHDLEYGPPLPPLGEIALGEERLFKFSKSQIDALKSEATFHPQEQPYKFSTYEVLAGHLWRSVCKARGLTGDQNVKLYILIDGRSRLKDPPLPQGYFGNAIFYMACVAKAYEITQKPLCFVASMIQEKLQRFNNKEYSKSAIDYLESHPDLKEITRGDHSVTSPNLAINSWGKIPFSEADFGGGKARICGPWWNSTRGTIVLCSQSRS